MNQNADVEEIARASARHARAGDTRALRALLDLGFPVDARNGRGDSLLMLASYNGHLETARLCLTRGAHPDLANDRGQTPLAGAAFKGDVAMMRLLIDHGANPNATMPDGKTALELAAMFDRVEAVELLLALGARNVAPAIAAARALGAGRALDVLQRPQPETQ